MMELAKILLVEDNLADHFLFCDAVRKSGWAGKPYHARDGEEAMDFLYRRGKFLDAPRPDLIVLDLNLPRLDGHEVLREIKRDSELATIPVIVLSSTSRKADMTACYDLGGSHFLQKRSDLEEVAGVVREIERFWREQVRSARKGSSC